MERRFRFFNWRQLILWSASAATICGAFIAGMPAPTMAADADTGGTNDPMRRQLQAFLDGKLPPEKLQIVYSDLHGLYGGLQITIDGAGNVDQKVVRSTAPQPQRLTPEGVRELVALLIQQEAWEQKVPEAVLIPDESRATLKIVAGDASSVIWERVREMPANNRLVQIRALMQKLAWPADKTKQ